MSQFFTLSCSFKHSGLVVAVELLVACEGWLNNPTLPEGVGEMETAFSLAGGDTWPINGKRNGFSWTNPPNVGV